MQIDLQQLDPSALAELGLVHKYPLHIDVVNNKTGFALYVATPWVDPHDRGWKPLFTRDDNDPIAVHHTDYDPDRPHHEYDSGRWAREDLFLRIREVDDGKPGDWHTLNLDSYGFTQNIDPPEVLDVDGFDSVTWFEGLEPDKDYQVQMWVDTNYNGQLDTKGMFTRGSWTDENGNEVLDDYYFWQEADVYSGIHTLNTDAEDFNMDIDADGTMDYFIS